MKKALAQCYRLPKPDPFVRFLANVSRSDVVTSIYYTGRLLQRRQDLDDVYQGFRVPGVASEPTDQQQEIAFGLLRLIEQIEDTPVGELTEAQADKYILRLGRIVRQRMRAEYGYHPKRGEELLAALRAQFK